MTNNSNILAIIPARVGSKGIPKKNMTNIAGKPLISYSIIHALNSRYINRVIASTNDKDVAEISNNYVAKFHL